MHAKSVKLLGNGIVLSLLTSTLLHATNGDNLIAVGAKARGMGGTSIATAHGAESGLSNPAMITTIEGTEIEFGGTLFMPDIKTQLMGQPEYDSSANTNMIPEVSIAHKIDENWYVGVGMWGTAGMGTDYSDKIFNPMAGAFANFNMVTNLQLLQFGVPIAYKTEGFSVAVTPIMQYGNLDINYHMPTGNPSFPVMNVGAGLAQDFGFGFNVGFAYDFTANGVPGLTVGALYKSSIEMEYDNQLTHAIMPFAGSPAGLAALLPHGDKLEQPEEYGVGISYMTGPHTVAFDYKNINWSGAKGYGDFGWDDSDVFALGYQYSQNNWALRIGYNHADSAVKELMDSRLNFFNLLGFPANAEDHYTMGGSYEFSETFSVDMAYVYGDKATDTFDISGLGMFPTISTSHREDSLSLQLVYKF